MTSLQASPGKLAGKACVITGATNEIATTILFLASDDASFYTGADLTPDGGTRDI